MYIIVKIFICFFVKIFLTTKPIKFAFSHRSRYGLWLFVFRFKSKDAILLNSIVHIASDILYFGIPMEVEDTGSNESGYKVTKSGGIIAYTEEGR